MRSPDDITPVEEHGGILMKRDDLFAPFGEGTVNGGKLRQCFYLVDKIKDDYKGLISCCSIYSPQAPITASVGRHFGMPVTIFYGGTTKERAIQMRMPNITMRYGAKMEIASKSGIHSILYMKAKKYASENDYFVVDYGFNIMEYPDILIDKVANQVVNIPDVDNLVITCGSGITATSIMLGIKKYKKKIGNIWLIATAPDRTKFINNTLKAYDAEMPFNMVDLFHKKGFVYERGVDVSVDGIKLHPNYEAKTYSWLKNNKLNGSILLWVVGAKPMR